MFRIKRARSLIHSLAHHGVSALSWLHPRLGEECKLQSVAEIVYDLLNGKIYNSEVTLSKESLMAFGGLKVNFERIASLEGIYADQLSNASICFGFKGGTWPNYCICSIESKSGKKLDVKVDSFGNKYGLLSQFQSYN